MGTAVCHQTARPGRPDLPIGAKPQTPRDAQQPPARCRRLPRSSRGAVWSAELPRGTAGGELVALGRDGLVLGALAGQLGQGALDLAPDAADGDAEHALTTLEEVDDLVVAGALVDRGAVAH